jgi:hypothetical protein
MVGEKAVEYTALQTLRALSGSIEPGEAFGVRRIPALSLENPAIQQSRTWLAFMPLPFAGLIPPMSAPAKQKNNLHIIAYAVISE